MSPHWRSTSPRPYARVARVNELVHQIVADELERIGDERLELVTVMRVEVDPDLRHATVWVDTPEGGARDADVLVALRDQRTHLQAAVGRQSHLKRTPELTFEPEEVERTAARVEDILRTLHPDDVADDEVDDAVDEAVVDDAERAGDQDGGSGSGASG